VNPRQSSQYRRELRTIRKRERKARRKLWEKFNRNISSMSLGLNRITKTMAENMRAMGKTNLQLEVYKAALSKMSPCPFAAKFGSSECGSHICPDGIIDECEAYENARNKNEEHILQGGSSTS
jgi:hypothetical protein